MEIDVTQYMRPNGRIEMMKTDISDAFEVPYNVITRRGWRVAAEVIATGAVSITVEDDEQDFACDIAYNGPAVQKAIEGCIAIAISAEPVEDDESGE
jgi:hypothetical protein